MMNSDRLQGELDRLNRFGPPGARRAIPDSFLSTLMDIEARLGVPVASRLAEPVLRASAAVPPPPVPTERPAKPSSDASPERQSTIVDTLADAIAEVQVILIGFCQCLNWEHVFVIVLCRQPALRTVSKDCELLLRITCVLW